jgi:hypothetical protein
MAVEGDRLELDADTQDSEMTLKPLELSAQWAPRRLG